MPTSYDAFIRSKRKTAKASGFAAVANLANVDQQQGLFGGAE